MDRKALRILALVVAAILVRARGAAAQPIGVIDTPTENQTVSGIVQVSGFVLDMHAVSEIDLLIDGNPTNRAEMNLPRVDVLEIFPTYYGSPTAQPGFLTSFLARGLSDGLHTVSISVIESADPTPHVVATVDVNVDNTLNQAPFGYIDIPGPGGLQGATGSFPVTGWALDDIAVDHIDFLIDGQIVSGSVGSGAPSPAVYGTPRPDVAAAFPDVPNSLYSGYQANIDTTKLDDGAHLLKVRATDNQGASRGLGSRAIQVANNGQNLGPFGQIDFPLDKASLFCGTSVVTDVFPSPCTPELCGSTIAVVNVVKGWALDVGARLDQGRVAYLELLLDGQIIANTSNPLDCVQVGQALTNCYGLSRPDVAQHYSGYPAADIAGFSFAFSLLHLTNDSSGLIGIYLPVANAGEARLVGFTTPGQHSLRIRAGDDQETETSLGEISVDVLCDETKGDRPAFGYIDTPTNYEFINGIVDVFGWAYDFQGVVSVKINVDGQDVGTAAYGLARPDVPANDPRVPTSLVGFSFLLDTSKLSNTEHDIVAYVTDKSGNRSEVGRRKCVVDNNVVTHQ